MSALFSLRLLGAFSLFADNVPMEGVRTARLQSLLAYLALSRETPHLRQHLAFTFWPDSTEMQARNNLRQLLHALRHTAPEFGAVLAIDNSAIRWRRDATFQLDVHDFEQAIARAEAAERRNDPGAAQSALEHAVTLYHGDLLPSCYDAWIAPERERLRQQYLQTLTRLVEFLEGQGKYTQAIRYAQRLTQHDPLNEEVYRRLMRLFARIGDRVGGARVYRACKALLERELGVEPSQETQDIYESLVTTSAAPYEQLAPLVSRPSLIGRQREWGQIQRAWEKALADGPGFALITGEAGIGKSRLAEELLLSVDPQEVITAKSRSYAAEGDSRSPRSRTGCVARACGPIWDAWTRCGLRRWRALSRNC